MPHIDENLPLTGYLKATLRTVDGLAWLMTCCASFLFLLDILLGFNLVPLRDAGKPGKAIVLLLSSPLLVFLVMVWFRQLWLDSYGVAAWVRAAICMFFFVAVNF